MPNSAILDARLESDAIDLPLTVLHFEGREIVSRPFHFTITVLQPEGARLDLDEVVGAEVGLVLSKDGAEVRRVHGIVQEIERTPESRLGRTVYTLSVVPRLLRATYVKNSRVHVDVDVTELLQKRLSMLGFTEGTDFVLRLGRKLPRRPMVVQYAETDFAFLSRLFEQHGLAYHFVHEEGRDVLVLSDSSSGFEAPEGGPVAYRGAGERTDVFELRHVRRLIEKSFVSRDYDYKTPNTMLSSERIVLDEGDLGGVLDFGLNAESMEEATYLARTVADQALARRDEHRGTSDRAAFGAGQRVVIEGFDEELPELLLVEVHHSARFGEGTPYENRFVAIPSARMPRPARTTHAPRIHGLLHAVVQTDAVGTVSKRAKIDSEGRYFVKFRFDPAVQGELEAASCPVRMLQPSAGPGYGMHFPLRPGIEVLVGFIGGDPDRPVIVGAAPNSVTPSPVASTSSNKNRIRTSSGAMIEFDDGT